MTEGNCPRGCPDPPPAELQVFMCSVAVTIWATLVNTQTDRHTDRQTDRHLLNGSTRSAHLERLSEYLACLPRNLSLKLTVL